MENGKKILMIGNSELVIFKFRRELVERLVSEGYEVYTAYPVTEFGNGEIAEKFGRHFVELEISSHGTNPFADRALIRRLKKLMRNIRPDVVLSYTIKPNLYGTVAAAKYRIPIIANVTGLGTAVEQAGFLQKVTVALYRYAFPSKQRLHRSPDLLS